METLLLWTMLCLASTQFIGEEDPRRTRFHQGGGLFTEEEVAWIQGGPYILGEGSLANRRRGLGLRIEEETIPGVEYGETQYQETGGIGVKKNKKFQVLKNTEPGVWYTVIKDGNEARDWFIRKSEENSARVNGRNFQAKLDFKARRDE